MTFRTITLDCAGVANANVGTIDAIARVHRNVRRQGLRLRILNASRFLVGLIDLCGLAEILGVETGRQAEEGEQPGRIEEERDVGDPTL